MPDSTEQTQVQALARVNAPLNTVAQVLDHPDALESFDDIGVRNFIIGTKAIISLVNERGRAAVKLALGEFSKRMHERNTHVIPDLQYKIQLEDEVGDYVYDVDALVEAAKQLPPEEAAKIVSFVGEQVIPAHYEPGSSRSIAALQKAYENTPIGELLNRGMTRPVLGKVVKIEERKSSKAAKKAA